MKVLVTVQAVHHLVRQWAAAKRRTSAAEQVLFHGLIQRLRMQIWWTDCQQQKALEGLMRICICPAKLAFSNSSHKLMMGQLSLGRK